MVVSLNLDDTRRISSSLTAMINEKQRVMKESGKKKKGAAKKTLKMGNDNYALKVYDGKIILKWSLMWVDTYDEFEDFM